MVKTIVPLPQPLSGEGQQITITVAPSVEKVWGQDKMTVKIALLYENRKDIQRTAIEAYSFMAIKHDTDKHHPENALKHALTEVLKLTEQGKGLRGLIWKHMREKFEFILYLAEYNDVLCKYDGDL